MDTALLIARLVLSAIFVLAAIGKFLDLEGSREAMKNFGLPEPIAKPFGFLVPLGELVVAILLLPVATALPGAMLGLVLLLGFIAGITYNLTKGKHPDCHCFGVIHSAPIGASTLIRNGVFSVIALFIIVFGWDDAGASLVGWSVDMGGFEWLVLVIGLLILAVVIAEAWFIVHMLGQNGRLLLRIDQIEQEIAEIAAGGGFGDEEDIEEGLEVGATAPGFKLEGIYGETMTLDALKAQGKPVVLVFSDPGCGPCNALMPDLGKLQKEHAGKLTIAVLSRGDRQVNIEKAQKNGLSLVLLQQDREVAEAYDANGTPSGVLITTDGKIASGIEPGADRIKALLARAAGGNIAAPAAPARPAAAAPAAPAAAAKPAAPQQPRPNIGDAAPDFNLPDLNGRQTSLADFRGQKSVVIFWSPTCGFCKRMADDIKGWEAAPQAGAPKAIIITSGDVEANRAFGFRSTVLMDSATETMKKYGTGGTPTAMLIDEQGKIASVLRVGQPGVMSLLKGEEVPAPQQAPAQPAAPKAKIGDAAPSVKLPDVNGNQFDLASLRGKKALVVFWNPGCGFCKRMVDDLKAWEGRRSASDPEIVLVSTGTPESNLALGLSSTTLLDQGFQVGRSFGASGTPSAVLIDENGRIASEVGVGSPKVLSLAGASN